MKSTTKTSIKTNGYAALSPTKPLEPFSFERREPRPLDVVIETLYCGVCHSDIHMARDEWGGSRFPLVPGHEIVGRVTAVGGKVTKFKVGDLAGVGCIVDSCRSCSACESHLEQYCERGMTGTYNSYDRETRAPNYGGYSSNLVVDEAYALKISPKLDLAATAPLLCAGITTYSPLKHWKIGKDSRVGIIGLGGLGHMGVKFAAAFGAQVTVFTTSPKKRDDALRLGANQVVVSTDSAAMEEQAGRYDFILNTVSVNIDLDPYLRALKREGTMVFVGLPEKNLEVPAFPIIGKRKSIAGSMIGGIKETQEMLDFCATHGIVSDIETIKIQDINQAFDRVVKADVKYRFVIDLKSLT